MPHSWHYPIGSVLDRVVRLQPGRVMDIGVGFGKWGFLVREALDWNVGRLERAEWRTVIHGVEAYPYSSPLHDWVYDEIIWSDVLEVVDRVAGYDLILMNDVIEHIAKDAALDLLRAFAARNGTVVISTPLEFFEQEIAGNDHEHHVSHWTMDDYDGFIFDYAVAGGAAMVVTLAGTDMRWPTKQDMRLSRLLYRIPGLASRGGVAELVKRAGRRATPRAGSA
jgi:hypothetical protein